LLDLPIGEIQKRAEKRDRHRSSPEHLARKRLIMEMYDVPYFNANKKNVTLILNTV